MYVSYLSGFWRALIQIHGIALQQHEDQNDELKKPILTKMDFEGDNNEASEERVVLANDGLDDSLVEGVDR